MSDLPGATVLAPSEQVYLRGEVFASKAGIVNSVKLMHIDQKVSVNELVQAILSSAFLNLEKSGALRLEPRSKKALFGLTQTQALYAEPVKKVEFPAGSIENDIYELAVYFKQKKETNEVVNIVYALLKQDSNSPWQDMVSLVQKGLASRGLLNVVQEKKLKVFTVSHYEFPESTGQLALQIPAETLKQAMEDSKAMRPEIWKLLSQQIKKGVDNRYKSSDD